MLKLFGCLEGGNKIFNQGSKAQDPMVVALMSRLKWADLMTKEVIIPGDCIVERGSLFPPKEVIIPGDCIVERGSLFPLIHMLLAF